MQTCRDLGFDAYEALRASLPSALTAARFARLERYDLIFADPPYAFSEYASLVASLGGKLAPGGLLGVEHAAETSLEARIGELERSDVRSYGGSSISFFRHTDAFLEEKGGLLEVDS